MTANWWGISASIVAWLGVAVIALALIGPWIKQRVRRRRRCPKCWYDLSHSPAPAMTCSECGYTAKRERKLYKARKRWKLAFLGAFMLLGAYALNVTPAVKDRGWVAAVPTTVLILSVPLVEEEVNRTNRWDIDSSWSPFTLAEKLAFDFLSHRLGSRGWRPHHEWIFTTMVMHQLQGLPTQSMTNDNCYVRLLTTARLKGALQTKSMARLLTLSRFDIHTRSCHVMGEPVYAEFVAFLWPDWRSFTISLQPRITGLAAVEVWSNERPPFRISTDDPRYIQPIVLPTSREDGNLSYDVVVALSSTSGGTILHKSVIAKTLTAKLSSEDCTKLIESAVIDRALSRFIATRIQKRADGEGYLSIAPTNLQNARELRRIMLSEGIDTLAVQATLFDGNNPIAGPVTLWRRATQIDPYRQTWYVEQRWSNGRWRVPIDLSGLPDADVPSFGRYSVHLSGCSRTALEDVLGTTHWHGEIVQRAEIRSQH